jgi:DNA-binding LacI/PurR family transcriptional regulator
VVHGQDRVRPSTRARVLEVIEALGYVPDSAAQSMVRQRKEVIGLLAVESRSPDTDVEQQGLLFIEEVLRGVEASLGAIEWSLLIALLRDDDPAAAYRRMQKISAKVDGMLLVEGIVSSEHRAPPTSRTPTSSASTTGPAPGRRSATWSNSTAGPGCSG